MVKRQAYQPILITDASRSQDDQLNSRQRRYVLMMGIRVLCIVACLFVRGWWLLIPALGTIILPYVAVVLGNVGSRRRVPVELPGTLELPPGRDGA